MYKLFFVLCKLLGLYCVIRALLLVEMIILYLSDWITKGDALWNLPLWTTMGSLASFTAQLGFAFFLLFKTDTLVRWIGIERDDTPIPSVQGYLFAKIGFFLLGLYFVIQSAPQLLSNIGNLIGTYQLMNDHVNRFWGSAAADLVKVILGAVLLDKAGFFARKLAGAREEALDA